MTASHRPPTSVDVARWAGVSRTTVSYVLNGTPNQRISPETRERVLAAAHELNYYVHPSARALRKGQNDDIYFILDHSMTLFLSTLTSELQLRAQEKGYTLAVYFNNASSEEDRRAFLWRLFSQRPLGIIAFPGSITEEDLEHAKSRGAGPCVFVSDWGVKYAPSVQFGAVEIGRLIAQHLLERGHRHIGVIAPQNVHQAYSVPRRLAGMRSVFKNVHAHNLQILPIADTTLAEARRVAEQLAQAPSRPTAIYGFNDEYCFHLLRALSEQGLRVPEDIALVGADDTSFCELSTPSLTSVRFDVKGIGRNLIDCVDRLANGEVEFQLELIEPPVLVPRESS